VKVKSNRGKAFLASALGAALVILCGLAIWKMSFGESWINTSYDYLFRFGSRAVTNKVVLIRLDNEAYDYFHQRRGESWDRKLHADLLNRLADDGCALAAFDTFFRMPRDPDKDEALAAAMRRNRAVVLMAEQSQVAHPDVDGVRPILPTEPFLSAATNWGVAWATPDSGLFVRRHWPDPSPGPYPSLPWTAARVTGARLDDEPRERWLRYYGHTPQWTELSYRFALTQPKGFYRDAIVFIGNYPKTSMLGDEVDEFAAPYTHWTGESVAGVEILITSSLNLINHDWLERLPRWIEILMLALFGGILGATIWRLHVYTAIGVTFALMPCIALIAIAGSYFTDRWFPWLIVVGAQLPCALAWALVTKLRQTVEMTKTILTSRQPKPEAVSEPPPSIPGYELFPIPFGEGAYGKVWLGRNRSGIWEAVKVVYLAKFEGNAGPYDREFKGVNRYQPISDQHPGLLRVKFVSEKLAGYFYYVMELGDAVEPGWEANPASYKPRDLVNVRAHLHGKRLETLDCIRIGVLLCEALDFLHGRGLTHRDIKPQNVIFVNGQPRLADVGLIAEIRPDQERTVVGTPGYMPPAPEVPGTPEADIYSLGMVLYVLSTGNAATLFPEFSSTLAESRSPEEFHALNPVILKACYFDPKQRYASAAAMLSALREAQRKLEDLSTQRI
jgi:CHASE2 domain-containing sensor protein